MHNKKYFDLSYNSSISIENLLEAFKEFKRGKSNKPDVQEFEFNLMSNILSLHRELKNKTYKHGSYEAFRVNDPKPRDIHKASVRDRVLHHAIYKILYPPYDKTFIADSYSCRNDKGVHKAIIRFEKFTRKVSKNYTTQCYILKCDIRKFFASVDQNILIKILEKKIEDKDVLDLLKNITQSFDKGLPLGNLTSQLLVNIYMNEFDQYVKHIIKQKYYIRYADDFVFISESKNELEMVCQKCEAFLTQTLRLSLHPDKCFIKTIYSGLDFLGWVHFSYHRVLRTSTKRRMMRKVNESNLSSYEGLLGHGNGYELSNKISEYVKESRVEI
jgi:retron-type reverse transcriptase